jgi:hypothetical protein
MNACVRACSGSAFIAGSGGDKQLALAKVAGSDVAAVYTVESVFSKIRNGRVKVWCCCGRCRAGLLLTTPRSAPARSRTTQGLLEALEAGFNIESEDEQGNTALLVSAQNVRNSVIVGVLEC